MKKLLLALAMCIAVLVPLSVVSPAHAAYMKSYPGWCNGAAYWKVNTWGITKSFGGGLTDVRFRISATAGYWWCENGTGSEKVRVFNTGFCVTQLDSVNYWSDNRQAMPRSFKWNAYHYNLNGKVVNPPQTEMAWPWRDSKQGDQHCDTQDIPFGDQINMYMYTYPRWTLSGWAVIDDWPDQDFTFKEDGYTYHELTPRIDAYVTIYGT